MPKSRLITALDIGSSCIKMMVVSKKIGEEDFEVLAHAQQESAGVRRGVVSDPQRVAEIISSLKDQIEEEIGQRINDVYVNINGSHLSSIVSTGLISVSRADQKISEEDLDRVIQNSRTVSLSSNQEIIDIFPKGFIVDGGEKVKDPVGMKGLRLETEALIIYGFSPYIQNLTQAVSLAGFQINNIIPSYIASSQSVLSLREKELGVCVLDIGAATTNLAVFEEENLIHSAVFPVGSGNITNDLAICLKIDIDKAEKIKLDFQNSLNGSAKSKKSESKIKIEDENGEEIILSRKDLKEIVEARISEILDFAGKELKKISRYKNLPAGVVLTGGGANFPRVREMAKSILKLPARIGAPDFGFNFKQDLSFSTLCGLVLSGLEDEEEYSFGFGERFLKNFKKIINAFMP